MTGYLLQEGDQLIIAERGDGSGVRIRVASPREDIEDWFIEAIIGYRVNARGMHDLPKGSIMLDTVGQSAYPPQPAPNFPPPEERT